VFRFQNPHYLYLLILLPLSYWLYVRYWQWRNKTLAAFGNNSTLPQLLTGYSTRLQWQKFGLMQAALALVVLALANPQMGTQLSTVKQSGIDIMIALDVSNSMLAQDVQPSRLDRAKQILQRIVETRPNDRIGIIVFAGHAYLQMPLTTDHSAVKLFLQTLNPELVPTQGTAIAEAVDLAVRAFASNEKSSDQNTGHRALIVLSDGEDHESETQTAAQQANDAGIVILSLGIGTQQGGTIPIYANGQKVDEKRDENGQIVTTQLVETSLKAIANQTNGEYVHIQGNRNELNEVTNRLNQIEKREFAARSFSDYNNYFQLPLALALLCLAAYVYLPDRKE
jgi:Ca-activated chloride channel family protein